MVYNLLIIIDKSDFVTFYLETGSEFVISKSEDYLAVLFFAFS